MATTSNSGSGQKHSASSSSRFGSLKVFKFAAVSSKNSPPIPPPKEKPPTNSSFVSLTAESSAPTTPVSPDYARSQSTPPYPPTHSPALSSQDPASASSSTSFGRGLIKFAKRSLTPKSVTRQLSEHSEDGSISMPWNFQHNMHVDEGYHGLPPSWVASLAKMGYSEEEIEAITYRRSASRATSTIPFQHPNFPNLPSSSQLSIITTTTQNTRDRVTPSPSIRRQPSQASIQSRGTRRTRKMSTETARSRQSFYQSSSANNSIGDLTYVTDDFPPPLPSKPPAQLNGHTHMPKKSVDTLASGLTSSGQLPSPITRSKSPHDFPPTPSQSQLRSRPSQNRTASKDSVAKVGKTAGSMGPPVSRPPRTPPRSASQTFRVVNTDALSQSPPPAYHLNDSSPINIVEKPSLSNTLSQLPQPQQLQPQLRKVPSTRHRQADIEPRASVLSTATITPRSDSVHQVADQPDTSGITGVDPAGGEDEEPAPLPPLGLSMSSLSTSPTAPAKKKKRYSLAPPRLSLGQDAFADIGGWGDNLFDSLSTTTTAKASVDGGSHPSTGSEVGQKRAPVLGAIDEERKPAAGLSVGGAGPTFLDTRKEEKDKESSGLNPPPSSSVSPAATTQKAHQPSQPSLSQPQASTRSQTQPRPTPPPKTPPIIPLPRPPMLSASTSSSSSTSTSSSHPPSNTQVLSSTTKTADLFPFPKPSPEPTRGRAGPHPPKSADSSLPRTPSATSISKSQSQSPRERSSSSVHRPLPPQKPLPTLSLMSPMPLPNPPFHVELKSKISVVSLKTAAKIDKEREKKERDREREKDKEEEDIENAEGVEKDVAKKDEKAKAMEEGKEGMRPMTAKETVQLMASINHENDGLDFGEQRKNQDGPVPALTKTDSVLLDLQQSHDVRDPHLSVDRLQFDPNRLSNASEGSRGSTRSSGGGLKLVFRGSDCHNENRDSNVSTSTITHATIVSGPVEVLTRARADLVVSPGTPVTRSGSDPVGLHSPAMLDVTPPPELREGSSRETTPKQASPPLWRVDAMDEGRSLGGFEGRSPSPDFSTNSHSSSSATTSSCTGPASLNSANRAAGFAGPAIKHHSGWEGEEGARRVVVSSSPLASPYKSEFSRSDEGEEDDEVEEEDEEDAVLTMVNPSSGSRKGSVADLMDEITGQRRPSLAISPISSYSLMTREPHSNAASLSQLLSPLNGTPQSAGSGGSSPAQRYPGWVSNVLSKVGLETFVDEKIDPREYFGGLTEVAEGESGFVYQAKVVRTVPGSKLTKRGPQPGGVVAIKAVPILPSGSTKLEDLRREVEVLKRVSEDDRPATTSPPFSSTLGCPAGMAHVLLIEAMYVDLQEDCLWIRMELMERSLADVVALVEEGHMERLDEKVVARFASDMLQALSYLHSLGIAHRDVRSDNLLLNREGVLKIADFSNAVTVTPNSPTCTGLVGVIYWQAPEVRVGAYNPMKADVWSLGATIWEMTESTPPFHDAISAADLRDRWPPLTRAGEFSRSLHDFLTLCSNPVASRPESSALLQTPFVRNIARRSAVIQTLKKCRTIENLLAGSRPSVDSQGTFSRR